MGFGFLIRHAMMAFSDEDIQSTECLVFKRGFPFEVESLVALSSSFIIISMAYPRNLLADRGNLLFQLSQSMINPRIPFENTVTSKICGLSILSRYFLHLVLPIFSSIGGNCRTRDTCPTSHLHIYTSTHPRVLHVYSNIPISITTSRN